MKAMKPVKLIAEIGSVHDGSFGNAVKLIDAAAACGAHAVKFQTHIAAAETLRNAPNPPYFKGEPRFEYFTRTGFSLPQWKELAAACGRAKVEFLSSPFSLEAVDLLEEVGVGSYKIPSGEVTNIPLLKKIATTKKPVLLSSGMSDWAELDAAVAALRGGGPVTVLQCSSAYPCPPEQVGLNVMVRDARALRPRCRLLRSHARRRCGDCRSDAWRDRDRKAFHLLARDVWQRRGQRHRARRIQAARGCAGRCRGHARTECRQETTRRLIAT